MSATNKSIQEKTNELSKLVEWFDSDDFSLEEALEKYRIAEKLAIDIENDLSQLKNEIEIIKKKFDSDK